MEKFELVWTGQKTGYLTIEAKTFEEAAEKAQKAMDKLTKDNDWDDCSYDFLE